MEPQDSLQYAKFFIEDTQGTIFVLSFPIDKNLRYTKHINVLKYLSICFKLSRNVKLTTKCLETSSQPLGKSILEYWIDSKLFCNVKMATQWQTFNVVFLSSLWYSNKKSMCVAFKFFFTTSVMTLNLLDTAAVLTDVLVAAVML